MRKLLCTIFFLLLIRSVAGQDPQFTQFYANPLYLAPSFAGATQEDRVSSVYRNQWPSLPNAFVTYTFAYDHYFDNFNSGVGLLILRDVSGQGQLALTNIGVQYSYDIKINNFWHVRPGVHLNYTQRGINFFELIWNGQLIGNDQGGGIDAGYETVSDIDFSSSVLAYSDRYWVGFAVDHLLRPSYGFWQSDDAPTPMKFSFFGGAQVIKRGHLFNPIDESLSVAFLFRKQDWFKQLDLGVYWYKAPLMLGLWYRGLPGIGLDKKGDALAFLVGYKMHELRVGYSYDFTISQLVSDAGGAHEIAIIYEFKTSRTQKKRRMIPCPEF